MTKQKMFGLKNFSGSCWVNACLQGIFRIPELQFRYSNNTFDKENIIDECLCKIYKSKGEDGLKDLFEAVRTESMPAGRGIGDSHELFQYLCDKLSYLDKLCRFKSASVIECIHCGEKVIKEDSVIEYSLASSGKNIPISNCIRDSVIPSTIADWTCDKCNKKGCLTQQLIGTFPKVMVFHLVSMEDTSIDYSSILVVNSKRYALLSIICYNGSHWWTRGRNMPIGSSWFTLDDTSISDHGSRQFPVSNMMRMLIYYRLEE
jgi:ubiquitin C-terminal hydrolase